MTENIYQYALHAKLEKAPGEVILVGNTGLMIHKGVKPWEQHFMPDNFDPDKPKPEDIQKKNKYALIYPYAIWNFINSGISIPENQTIIGVTHKEMNSFRKHLLTSKIYESFQFGSSILYGYSFHIGQLLKEKEVLARIEKMAIKCERQHYLMLW